ncbi:MAG: polysaccharide biosynthesis protein [Gammaproteobacteria bacterium]|nr:polysaccharide biosynthesis protein [Gammaproteobacteria bacterium]
MINVGRRTAVVCHDLVMVSIAWGLACVLRLGLQLDASEWQIIVQLLPIVVIAQGVVLWLTGLYRGVWRFASMPDLWNIIRASVLGVLAIGLLLFLFNRLTGVPRASLVLYPIFLIMLLGGPRVLYRVWRDHGIKLHPANDRQRVLVLGAGRAGEMLARDMRREGRYLLVGFLDGDARLKGAKVYGVPVLGAIDQLPEIISSTAVDIIIIAMPSATNVQMRRVVELCEQVEVPFCTLPRLQDLVSGRVNLGALRKVRIEDLLGREPVSLDCERIRAGVADKIVLVSGAGGSIGSELCRQIALFGPAAIVLFERCEFNLYTIGMELRREFPNVTIHDYLGSVADAVSVEHAMDQYRPQIIFHAAAYKHVPMLEGQAREAVGNNVLGTKVMALAATKWGCETFVMVSTDKAVNPANVMGASKRAAELICQTLDRRSETRFITVRFGNVLGSAGSVVPLFQKQIADGGPVTVTHPDITRYFMTIPEACQLIMEAAVMGRGGEIFVLDMGEPVKIRYLAEQLILLSGEELGSDIEIVYTGLRPGEKLYEELFHEHEDLAATNHEKILLAQARDVEWAWLDGVTVAMEQACCKYDNRQLIKLIKELVPEMLSPAQHANSSEGTVVPLAKAVSYGR